MKLFVAALAVALFAVPTVALAGPSIVGSMQGWDTADPEYDLVLAPNGVYELTKTLSDTTHLYKGVDGDIWGLDFPANNQTFTFESPQSVTWYANLGATVGVKEGDEYIFHSMNPPIACGDFMSELGGTDWDQSDTSTTVLSDPDEDGIWEWSSVVPAGSYQFKIVLNNNWDQDTYPPSQNYFFDSDGITEILIRYHMQDNTTEVFSESPPTVVFATAESGDGPIRVKFSKNVDETTAQTPGNYTVIDGRTVYTVLTATLDTGDASVVRLTTNPSALPAGESFEVTVSNVEDLEGRPVDPDHDNWCFYTNEVTFEVNMQLYIIESGMPATVHIQGDTEPLTWDICEGSQAMDDGVPPDAATADSTYTVYEYFSVPYNCDLGPEDKSVNLPSRTVNVWWDDQAPGDLIECDVGVRFQVTHSNEGWIAETDTLSIRGSELPLDWDAPDEITLNDAGIGGDLTAGDGIYSTLVVFPTGTYRYLEYKYLINGDYECSEFPNRTLELDDVNGCVTVRDGPMEVLDLYDWCEPLETVIEGTAETSWGQIKGLYRNK